MRNLMAAALGVVAVATAHICAAAAAVDAVIAVEGNRRIDAAAIRAHFHGVDHAAPGAALSPAAIDASLKELYATGLFEDVKIARSGAGVIVTVVEAPMLERVQFEGNKQFKDKDLVKEIALKPRGPMTRSAVAADVARLVEFYRRSGRYDATITPKAIARGDGGGRVDLVFEIAEGAKTGVKRIAFSGNRAFSDDRLKNLVKTTESGWFAFLKAGDVYDPDRVEADGDLLRRFCLKSGFADVRVAGTGVYDPELRGFIVSFAIEEGERYRLGAVDIVSRVPAIDAAALRGALRIASGSVYDGDAVAKAADAIALAAAKCGSPFVTVRPRVSRNAAARTVDLAFVLDDGPHAYIERIAIRGNTVTRDCRKHTSCPG
jgi:outer membrane protein insertion porin family